MSDSNIGLILLAAGASTRMAEAGPKQLLVFSGTTLLRRAGLTAASSVCRPLILVTGFEADSSSAELADLPFKSVYNPDWPDGIGSSIRAGVTELERHSAPVDGVVIMLCDQPLLTADLLNLLVETAGLSGSRVVASQYDGVAGVPAFFAKSLFNELQALPSDKGAQKLIKSHAGESTLVPFPGGTVDIDTFEDYRDLI